MNTFLFGLVAVLAGAAFCFRGYLAFRIVIPVWGAFVGFTFGAGLVSGLSSEAFLTSALQWGVAIVAAIAFAALAYLFFEVAVAIAMASIGFSLGGTLMLVLGVDWTWLIIVAGVALGVLLAYVAITAELPMMLLVVLSAFGGSSAIATGFMLWTGAISTDDITTAEAVDRAASHWYWYLLYFAVAVAGIVIQLRDVDERRASMREAWVAGRPHVRHG